MDLTAPAIEIVDLNKLYGSFHALRGISMTVRKGEKVVVCGGRSNSGRNPASTGSTFSSGTTAMIMTRLSCSLNMKWASRTPW